MWRISTKPRTESHFAMFPIDLPLTCIAASTRPGDVVLDPFTGAGTTGVAAKTLGRRFVGIELVPSYADLAVSNLANAEQKPARA